MWQLDDKPEYNFDSLVQLSLNVSAGMIQRKAALSLAGAIVTSLILVYFVTLDYSRNILPKRISYNPPLSYDARNTSASGQEKAAFVILARNSDLGQILTSIQAVEDRFNNRHGHHYSYVFLSAGGLSISFNSVRSCTCCLLR